MTRPLKVETALTAAYLYWKHTRTTARRIYSGIEDQVYVFVPGAAPGVTVRQAHPTATSIHAMQGRTRTRPISLLQRSARE